jgi:hypothetical protein
MANLLIPDIEQIRVFGSRLAALADKRLAPPVLKPIPDDEPA